MGTAQGALHLTSAMWLLYIFWYLSSRESRMLILTPCQVLQDTCFL